MKRRKRPNPTPDFDAVTYKPVGGFLKNTEVVRQTPKSEFLLALEKMQSRFNKPVDAKAVSNRTLMLVGSKTTVGIKS